MKLSPRFRILVTLIAVWFSISDHLSADIIPPSRKMSWTPGTVVGVPGGIPNRTIIGANVKNFGAVGDGVADDTAAIVKAKNACSDNQVVYFPAGTYKFSADTSVGGIPARNFTRSNVTYRGAGMRQTTLKLYGGNSIYVGDEDWNGGPVDAPTVTVTAGATAGSSILTVNNTADINVGKLIIITQLNPSWVHSNSNFYGYGPTDDGHPATRLMALTVKVTAKTGSTVTIEHPLPIDMANSPMITPLNNLQQGVGFEDLTFDMTNSDAAAAVSWYQVYGCWMKNLEVKNSANRQFWLQIAANCEIRGCYTHDSRVDKKEGIDLYHNCCWNLIEDNICVRSGFPMIILGDWGGGCSGNVVAYNYLEDERGLNSQGSVAPWAISDNHGPHNMFNLIEGNVAQNFSSDGYYGSASHTTVFRNWFTGKYDRSFFFDENAVNMSHWATSYNLVGNVFGTGGGYSTVYQASGTDFQNGVIYKLGYPNAGNRGFSGSSPNPAGPDSFDTNVGGSMIRHGNFNYADGSTNWDSTITDHVLPNSYYLSGRPSWWSPSIAWPPIGPDRTPMVTAIPAQVRLPALFTLAPSPPTGLKVVP